MRLPPVDVFRAPFVEPIGHLAMQAAYAEDNLIELCATIPSPDQMTREEVAHQLRNWGEREHQFVLDRLHLIEDTDLKAQATDCVERWTRLRERRHRAVHDAIDVGIFENDHGYEARPLGVQYKRTKGGTSVELRTVSPESIAEMACEMHEIQKDIEAVTYSLNTTLP